MAVRNQNTLSLEKVTLPLDLDVCLTHRQRLALCIDRPQST